RSGGMQTDSRVDLGRQDRIRILTLVDGWGLALGFPSDLTRWPKTIFDPDLLPENQNFYISEETVITTKSFSGTVSDDAADAAMRSLAEILDRKQQVSGQLSYDVSPVDPNRFGDPGDLLNPRSLDIALVNLAMRLERIDAPEQWLGSADDTSAQTPASGATQRPVDRLLAGTWAIAQQDSGAMTRMIDQIAEELKSELPPLDHQTDAPEPEYYSNESIRMASEKVAKVGGALRLCLPVAVSGHFDADTRRKAIELLTRVGHFMSDDSHLKRYDSGLKQLCRCHRYLIAMQSQDWEVVGTLLRTVLQDADRQSQEVLANNPDFPPEWADQNRVEYVTNFCDSLINAGISMDIPDLSKRTDDQRAAWVRANADGMMPLIRLMLSSGTRGSRFPADMVRWIDSLDPDSRFDVLMDLVWGDDVPQGLSLPQDALAKSPRDATYEVVSKTREDLAGAASGDDKTKPTDVDASDTDASDAVRKAWHIGLQRTLSGELVVAAIVTGRVEPLREKIRQFEKRIRQDETRDAVAAALWSVLLEQGVSLASGAAVSESGTRDFDQVLTALNQDAESARATLETLQGNPQSKDIAPPGAIATGMTRRIFERSVTYGSPRKPSLSEFTAFRDVASLRPGVEIDTLSIARLRVQLEPERFMTQSPIAPFENLLRRAEEDVDPSRSTASRFALQDGRIAAVANPYGNRLVLPFPIIGNFTVSLRTPPIRTDAWMKRYQWRLQSGPESAFPQRIGDLLAADSDGVAASFSGLQVSGVDWRYGGVGVMIDDQPMIRTDLVTDTPMVQEATGRVRFHVRNQYSKELPTNLWQPKEWNTESIRIENDAMVARLNGTDLKTIRQDFKSAPWLEIDFSSQSEVQWKDLQIEGDVIIPREVPLISPTLMGWSNPQMLNLPELDVPRFLDQDDPVPAKKKKKRKAGFNRSGISWAGDADEDEKEASPTATIQDDTLEFAAPKTVDEDYDGQIASLSYERMLQDGDSISGKFFFPKPNDAPEPGADSLAPPDDMILVQCGGRRFLFFAERIVQTTDLTGSYDLDDESDARPDGVERKTLATEGVRVGQWNDFTVTRQGDRLIWTLGGQPLADVAIQNAGGLTIGSAISTRAQFRDLVLTGPWPEEMPEVVVRP
ncbi:MAG: DUF1581 domain-containing protein, partial [Planctomycetota bacterium]